MNFEGDCKRIDLNLRSRYPYLDTGIYKINEDLFHIYVDVSFGDFRKLQAEFDNSIKFLSTPVLLVQEIPNDYEKHIDAIADSQLANNYEGLSFTRSGLINHIECQHPNLFICNYDEDHKNKTLNIHVNIDGYEGTKDDVDYALKQLGLAYETKVHLSNEPKLKLKNTDVFELVSSSSLKELDPGYMDRDQSLWFDNVEEIYRGNMKKSDLFFYDDAKSKCLLDFTVFTNTNIRNHLLLYDVVFCILPLSKDMNDFLVDQKLSRDDMLYLIEIGRLKIVNKQPEFRLDHSFIKECYQVCSESVISRRAVAALSAMDIVETESKFVLRDPDFIKDIRPLLFEYGELNSLPEGYLERLLTWPKSALRSSFDALNTYGTAAIPSFGVNKIITGGFSEKLKKHCELEFQVSSESIHIAHALDATYFPYYEKSGGFSEHPFSILMANGLNFYKLSNLEYIPKDLGSTFNPESCRNRSLELLSIFDIDEYVSLPEFIQGVENSRFRKQLNNLFSDLSTMPKDDRDERIKLYNSKVSEALLGKAVTNNALDLSVDAIGLFVPFLGTGSKVFRWFGRITKNKFELAQEISAYVEDKAANASDLNVIEKNVSILTLVNRVARLKRQVL